MPDMKDAHIDRALTNLSVAYMQDASEFIADKVFPIVKVKRQSDVYYVYNKGDFMRDEAQERGGATESAGGDYGVEANDPYYCKVWAFHKDVTERDRANYDKPLDADRDASDYVSQKMLIKRETEWASKFFTTGAWDNEITGVVSGPAADQTIRWDEATSDPIKDIEDAILTVAEATGKRPNTLALSPAAYKALKNHDDVLDRIKYVTKGIVTEAMLAALLDLDKVVVAWGVVNNAKKGATDDTAFIMGKHALLCYAAKSPGLKTPSAGYIFAWTGLLGSAGAFGARIVRIAAGLLGLGTERIEGECAFAAKKISGELGVFFYNIVS